VLVVARSGGTRKAAFEAVLEEIEQTEPPFAGIVVNRVQRSYAYYGYYSKNYAADRRKRPLIKRLAAPLRKRFSGSDTQFLKGSALVSAGMAIARLLGFLFSIVLARVFVPADFGKVQYAIALASIVALATQPFVQHVLARFIGKYLEDESALRRKLTNAWIVLLGLFAGTLLVATPVLLVLGRFNIGIILIYAGITLFYTYWGLASGFFAPGRLVIAYLGSNVVQIIATIMLIQVAGIESPTLAMAIYGLSYVLPIGLLQIFKPFPVPFQPSLISRADITDLVRFSTPIWVSQAAYALNVSIDLIFLEYLTDETTVGVYALARTLTMVFAFIPAGISAILMPKIAAMPRSDHGRLFRNMVELSLMANIGILIGYLLFGRWLIEATVGPEYLTDNSIFMILAISAILHGLQTLIGAVLIGSDRASFETGGRITALIVTIIICVLLIPSLGGLGAAISRLGSVLAAFVAYSALIFLPGRKTVTTGQS
jgi:O-antigen/teichoic acid export membrane protein